MINSFAPQYASKEQAERENQRLRSVYNSNFKFIPLVLNDIRRRTISGAEIVFSRMFINDQKGGIRDYSHEVKGGEIQFELSESRGAFVYNLLDTEHNRQFLASMWDRNFWSIEDSEVKKDIENKAKKITESLILKKEKQDSEEKEEDIVKIKYVESPKKKRGRPLEGKKVAVNTEKKEEIQPAMAVNLPDVNSSQTINNDQLVTFGSRVKQV